MEKSIVIYKKSGAVVLTLVILLMGVMIGTGWKRERIQSFRQFRWNGGELRPNLSYEEDRLGAAVHLLQASLTWEQERQKGRGLNLMTSVPLYQDTTTGELIDLYRKEATHPPVPNQWWSCCETEVTYRDALSRDFDGDGFTNLEEFQAGTDPSMDTSYPMLVQKLRVVRIESTKWKVYLAEVNDELKKYRMRYADSNAIKLRSSFIGLGARFFGQAPVLGRFILQDVKSDTTIQDEMPITIVRAQIRDGLKGGAFSVRQGKKNFFTGRDYEVTMTLQALDQKGVEFTLKEGSYFSLPYVQTSRSEEYRFIEVRNKTEVVIEHKQAGEVKQLVVQMK